MSYRLLYIVVLFICLCSYTVFPVSALPVSELAQSESVLPAPTTTSQEQLETLAPQFATQCYSQPAWLQTMSQQQLSTPLDDMYVEADLAYVQQNKYAEFSGQVSLLFNHQHLLTEQAIVDSEKHTIQASGGIKFSDGHVAVRADHIFVNTLTSTAQVNDAEYALLGNPAHGRAGAIHMIAAEGSQGFILKNGSFTTCAQEKPVWAVYAGEISMNQNESWGTAKNAQFRFFDIPVFYLPYFSFPITDARKTGLLYPQIRSNSRTGLEIEAPWYINIAPDKDATITPRYMNQRGMMLMAEYRQLTPQHQFQWNSEYLNNDHGLDTRPNRYFFRVENASTWNPHWSSYMEFLQSSDSSYVNDFNSAFANRADAYLYRHGQLNYHAPNQHLSIQVEDFQMLGNYTQPYRTLPRISYTQSQIFTPYLTGDLFSEFSHFRHAEINSQYASRYHVEPTATFLFQQPSWEWQTELSYHITHYEQHNVPGINQERITRNIPQFRTNFQLHLERNFLQGSQTLTPQIQYLYIPYQDQSNIAIYDTSLLQDDYHGLFRPFRFTGLDRIADAHQMTFGLTTSLYNQQAEELFRFSVGQIMYLEQSKTQLFNEDNRVTASNSELAGELDFQWDRSWSFSGAFQFDTTLQLVRKARMAIEYRQDENNLIQLNYRKVRAFATDDQNVEQVGLLATSQIKENWAVAAHVYQDIFHGKTMDALLGVQYETCCWAVRASAYRRINRNFDLHLPGGILPPADSDNGVNIQFMLTGLGGATQGLTRIFEQSIFGYRRPYYLNH